MIRILVIAAASLLLITFASADSLETRLPWGGNTETTFNYDFGGGEIPSSSSPPPGTGPGTPAKWYDVVCRADKTTFRDKKVHATCTLKFMGPITPQNDGVLQYFLTSPGNKATKVKQEMIREGNNTLYLTYNLPDDAETGHWAFNATWIVPQLAPMKASDVFNYKPQNYTPLLLIIVGLIAALLIFGFALKKRQDKEEEA